MWRTFMGSILIGTAGGTLAGLLVWWIAQRSLTAKMTEGAASLTTQFGAGREELERALRDGRAELDREVRERVHAEVPPAVQKGLDQAFASYGITPVTGRQINAVLTRAEQMGLIGIGRRVS